MTYTWNSNFDAFPSGSDFGSVSGRVIRETKAAFYERFIVEHDLTEGASPTATHLPGKTSIVGFGDAQDELFRTQTPQTLFWQYEDEYLYAYDEDSNPFTVATFKHSGLVGRSDDDHTQYAQDISDVTGALTIDTVEDLDNTGAVAPFLLLTESHVYTDHIPVQSQTQARQSVEYLNISQQTKQATATGMIFGPPYNTTYYMFFHATPDSGTAIGAYLDDGNGWVLPMYPVGNNTWGVVANAGSSPALGGTVTPDVVFTVVDA